MDQFYWLWTGFIEFLTILLLFWVHAQSYLTVCDPMDWGPAGSSVYGIRQARILEWVAMLSSSGSSNSGIKQDSLPLSHWSSPYFCSMLCFFSSEDLSSLTRDQTHNPALEGKVLTTGLPGQSHIMEKPKRTFWLTIIPIWGLLHTIIYWFFRFTVLLNNNTQGLWYSSTLISFQ